MNSELPGHLTPRHYAEIVALLRAINVKASVSFNGAIYGVQVTLANTRTVVWGNYDNWAFTLVRADGTQWVHNSQVRADAPADVAAKVIAFTDYVEPENEQTDGA
jgi:hypothetical protein